MTTLATIGSTPLQLKEQSTNNIALARQQIHDRLFDLAWNLAMKFKSGKHEGKEYAQVLLRDPGYANFLIDKQAEGSVGNELKRLISVFDGKPFERTCHHCECPATRATGYIGGSSLYFWCDNCDPYGEGANPGKLRIIRTYREVVAYAGTRGEEKDLVKIFAEAKGSPHPLTPLKAKEFLP